MAAQTSDAGTGVPPGAQAWARWRRWAAHPAGETAMVASFLMLLTLVVFGRVLFGPGNIVLSNSDADLAMQFVHWRGFGFGEMRAGRFPLWNPFIDCGTAFFGGFQSALLYPPNWLYLCLPLARAINVGIALHVFLAGFFMHLWVRRRGLHPLSGLLAAVLFMFSGPYFMHIYAGHLPNLCTMVWGPVILMSIDGWYAKRTAGWLLIGMGAVAMQILAGHPQYVFYTGVAAGLYSLLSLVGKERPWSAVAGLAVIVAGAVLLSAVQLFEGFHAAGESVRSHGTTLAFASIFSFPPENLITLLVPGFFGNMTDLPYWGRCYLWEMSLFVGVTGLVFAIYGAVTGRQKREVLVCMIMLLLMLVPALGHYTALFRVLYHYAPGFNKFRGWSKFIYPLSLFLVLLAAHGFDEMLRRLRPDRGIIGAVLGLGIVLVVAAAWAGWSANTGASTSPEPWNGWIHSLEYTGETYADKTLAESVPFVQQVARWASGQLFVAGGTLVVLGLVFLTARIRPATLPAVIFVAIGEMLLFAMPSMDTFRLEDATHSPVTGYLSRYPKGDYRIFNKNNPNLGMTTGERDLWGYDPGVLRRYAEWIAVSQNASPDDANEMTHFWHFPAIYGAMFRCHFVFLDDDGDATTIKAFEGPPRSVSPHVMLVPQVKVESKRYEIFKAMMNKEFDPRRTVILETIPEPAPASDPALFPGAAPGPDPAPVADPVPEPGPAAGSATLVGETSDSLTIEADVPRPTVLVVTDAYSDGWKARSLLPAGQGSGQAAYPVMPADYCLRAIPLAAGHHRLLLEYRPGAFVVGVWTSAIALLAYGISVGVLLYRRLRRAGPMAHPGQTFAAS